MTRETLERRTEKAEIPALIRKAIEEQRAYEEARRGRTGIVYKILTGESLSSAEKYPQGRAK